MLVDVSAANHPACALSVRTFVALVTFGHPHSLRLGVIHIRYVQMSMQYCHSCRELAISYFVPSQTHYR